MKKHYVDHKKVRAQSKAACCALKKLADMGVEVLVVKFRNPHPLIEVAPCSGTEKLRNFYKGQGRDENGMYIRHVAHMHGCQIEWNEARL